MSGGLKTMCRSPTAVVQRETNAVQDLGGFSDERDGPSRRCRVILCSWPCRIGVATYQGRIGTLWLFAGLMMLYCTGQVNKQSQSVL